MSIWYTVDGKIDEVLQTVPPFYEYGTEWSMGTLSFDLDHDCDIREISVHYYTGGSRMAHELLIKRGN